MAILIPRPAAIPKENLDELGAVKKPLSWPAAALTGKKYLDEAPGIDSMGIWECSPGRWERTIMQEEFAHFVKGSARFIPAHGAPIDIQAGDTIWFPANSAGIWEIKEDVRKVYIIIDRPNLWRKCKQALKGIFEPQSGQATRLPQPAATEPQRAAEPALAWRTAQAEPSQP